VERPERSGRPAEVEPVAAADVAGVAAMLARAFDDDPLTNWFFPSARRRAPGLRTYFRLQVEQDFLPHGEVVMTAGRTGAAIWAPPGKPFLTGWPALRSVLPVAPFIVGPGLRRVLEILPRVAELHPKEPHWYLATLGVEPVLQGKGLGSALLAGVLARCDDDGVPAYLESSKERNLAFYGRHGFTVGEVVQPRGGPKLWTMRREPRPPH